MAADLLGDKPEKKKAAKAESDGLTVRLETAFKDAYAHAFGVPYKSLPSAIGRERKLLKDLGAGFGEAETLALVAQYFANRLRRGNYTIVDFHRDVQALRLERQRRGRTQTDDNVEAARQAIGGKRKALP